MTARERVLAAAQRLFAERGYARVSIRQIAAEAGVSAALVMKVGGSKQQLYADATPPRQLPLGSDWPSDRVGVELVRRVLSRRDDGAVEPWLQDLLDVLDAADPAAARADFQAHYVAWLEGQAAAGPDHHERAHLITALMLGLAVAVRPLRLLPGDDDWVVERYGAMIQSLVDG